MRLEKGAIYRVLIHLPSHGLSVFVSPCGSLSSLLFFSLNSLQRELTVSILDDPKVDIDVQNRSCRT